MGRLCALAIVLGAALVQCLGALPSLRYLYMSGVALCLCCGLSGLMSWYLCGESGKQRQSLVWVSKTLAVVLVFLLSSTWATWRAEQRLNEALALEHENVVTRLTFQVASLPSDTAESIRFEAQVLAPCPPGVPRRLQVAWLKSPSTARILPGQIWRAALVLRRPHGNLNPQGFDYEGHLFAKNIRALARVRGAPQLLADEPYSSFGVTVARVRHVVREAMRRTTQTMTYGAVLIALAIGDQDSVEQKHWKVFNLTGITHLVSISGSHVTMIAALGAWVAVWCVKRFRWRGRAVCERLPASVAAASVALLVAWAYCLLAGWGIPAQRTFFMLAVAALALVSRYALSASRVLALAAAVVVLVDPWSPLATGFWLSFLAVAILFAAGVATIKPRHSQAGWQRFLLLCRLSPMPWRFRC